ncbi:hypothetical protein V8C34DRAFT_271789 [Trichoderma compactum]
MSSMLSLFSISYASSFLFLVLLASFLSVLSSHQRILPAWPFRTRTYTAHPTQVVGVMHVKYSLFVAPRIEASQILWI